MIKETNLILIAFFLVLIASNSVFAFSVASAYWEGKPLTAYAGETKTIDAMWLQNIEESDENVIAEIIKGKEIASLEKADYLVKAKTDNNPIAIKIKIPSNAVINTTYPVTVSFKSVTQGSVGGVALGVGYDTSFDVLVTSKPQEEKKPASNLIWIITAGIVVLIIIILIVLKRKKK